MRLIKARASIFVGSRTHGPDDPPFEVDDRRARMLVDRGLADFFTPIAEGEGEEDVRQATNPAPSGARKAVLRRA